MGAISTIAECVCKHLSVKLFKHSIKIVSTLPGVFCPSFQQVMCISAITDRDEKNQDVTIHS